jgi:hypothetical protein
MNIETIGDYRRAVRIGPYVWPGGYALHWIMADCEPLCWQCGAKRERKSLIRALADKLMNRGVDKQWIPIAIDIHWEGVAMQCAHCNCDIKSEYGNPETEESES